MLSIIGIALLPNSARAALMTEAVALIAAALSGFFSVIMNVEGAIINWLINPDTWGFTTNPTIIRAWRVVRDFVNLGFVLAIIAIAIGFILRIQTYGSQRTLTRLIVAAILVNFSLVIAGVFIDAANIVSRFLLRAFSLQDIWRSLVAATGLADLYAPVPREPWVVRVLQFVWRTINPIADAEAAGKLLVSTITMSIFAIMMIAALGALIVMLLLRIAHLWVLLVLAPAAWLTWIFPQFEGNWRRWWTEFLNWTFFAPIVIFFLSLSLTIIGDTNRLPQNDPRNFFEQARLSLGDVFREVIQTSGQPVNVTIARTVVAIAMIVLSMMIAREMSISFADQGMRWATSVGKWPGLTAWRAGLREGRRRFAASSTGQRLERQFAGSRVFSSVSDWIRRQRELPEAEMKNLRARYEPLDSATLRAISTDPTRTAAERITAAKMQAERGEFKNLPASQQRALIQLANSFGRQHAMEILANVPTLAPFYDQQIASPQQRIGRPGDRDAEIIRKFTARLSDEQVLRLSDADYQNYAVVLGLSPARLRRLAYEAPQKADTIRGVLGRGTPPMVQLISRTTGFSAAEVEQWLDRIRRTPELAALYNL
jgi:hypothetical protein